MRSLLVLLALPLFAAAQSSTSTSNSSTPSQLVITSTSLSAFVTLGPDRQISAGTKTIVFTSTSTIAPTQSASNNTGSTNSTAIANSTVTANSTSSSTTPTSPLPTAPTTISGGGGTNGAPLPGATGGAYGPDDKYIAAASMLARNTLLVGLGGLVVTGALMVL
ncbi:hypothetical protein C0991_000160 [Blastosporella zonata]|nr:hypothetical protein C0991_000160 [Blastosporella zonata]